MLDWVEFAVVRHAGQLRDLAAVRPLTETEQRTLDVCQSVIARLEIRESLPVDVSSPYTASPGSTLPQPAFRPRRTLRVRWRERRAS
jgi:hypothetical protein